MLTFIGTGGVGKTSLSLATALQAAQLGRRVAAITVDPSRRLTSLLGIEQDGQSKKTIEVEGYSGSLDVFHIQTSQIFNEFVEKHLNDDVYARLKKNKIYQQISLNLRETHNFASLYRMVQVCNMDEYDFVVLDTPPCHQVIDFFESPNRLKKFFTVKQDSKSSWTGWLQDKSIQVAENFIKPLVGKDFVREMDAFFQSVRSLREEIHNISTEFINQLSDDESQLVLVTPPSKDKLQEASYLVSELSKSQFHVSEFVLNRSHVLDLDKSGELGIEKDSEEYQIYNYFKNQLPMSKNMLAQIGKKLEVDIKQFSYIPEIEQEIHSLQDVLMFAKKVGDHWTSL